ncbi:hypothetical protein D3875_18895 [Deinococcus cavernae]|uniref:Uncharacterized protein n=1 Tax=Deinococcus cavernae TaxID=2320857 RepID=A0A418VBD2_9DEIO|nr:hypothetical protein [Deinococcus cavernae]RJF73312.1 hypothetical protein D3875_18895 [Deinococcus cavernae]
MASIHIREIMEILRARGENDASMFQNEGGYFLEILTDDPQDTRIALESGAIDEEFRDKVISVGSPFGSVLIIFDAAGMLKSLEFC